MTLKDGKQSVHEWLDGIFALIAAQTNNGTAQTSLLTCCSSGPLGCGFMLFLTFRTSSWTILFLLRKLQTVPRDSHGPSLCLNPPEPSIKRPQLTVND